MEEEVLLASVALLVLIESRSCSTDEADELPQEQDHEYIQWCQPEISLKENSQWVCPVAAPILVDFLEQEVADGEARYTVKHSTLQVCL